MTQTSLFDDPAPAPARRSQVDPFGDDARQRDLLRTALEMAVPLWVQKVRPYSAAWRQRRAQECADLLSAGGDQLQHRSPASGEVFDTLALGVACLAFQDGGVEVLGVRFTVPTIEGGA